MLRPQIPFSVPVFVLALALASPAQDAVVPDVPLAWPVDTGWVVNDSARLEIVASFSVHVEGAGSLRLYFSQITLGDGLLRVTSLLDGAMQALDAAQCAQWQQSTAYFNGDTVLVELLAPPGDPPGRLVLSHVDVGVVPVEPKSLCGLGDDRVPSNDPRIGRLMPLGCTAWLLDDCRHCFLSAGHCTGPLDLVEFNVPFSTLLGLFQHPGPEDQYAIDPLSQQGSGGGVGSDWAYFGAFPNPVTGLSPGEKQQAWFKLAEPPAAASQEVRVTGYGSDTTPDPTFNGIQQTATGPLTAAWATTLQYEVDTTGGDSGAPVILEADGTVIGIHTHAGCTALGGANQGTSSAHAGLQWALTHPTGACVGSCGFTDLGHPLDGSFGPPKLLATGLLVTGGTIDLAVSGLPLTGSTTMVIGLHAIDANFKGGVLVPAPDMLMLGIPITAGATSFAITLTPEIPAGLGPILQFWTADAGAVQGLSATNALTFAVP